MKGRGFIVYIGLIAIVAFSCKKDINPVVTYTIVDTVGAKLVGANVFTHPCFDGVSCDTSKLNNNFTKVGITNNSGQVTFEYPYTAIIEVIANWQCDSVDGQWSCYSGRTISSFESKRAAGGEENKFDVRVVLKKRYK